MNIHDNWQRYAVEGATPPHFALHIGRVALSAAFLLFPMIAFQVYGFSRPATIFFAVVCWALLEGSLLIWRRRRRARMKSKAVSLQAQLHDLNEEVTALRIAEAKARGAFDRFGTKE